jgi:hypothetical protein
LLADPLEGVRSVGAAEMVLMSATGRCEGTVALKKPMAETLANRNGCPLLADPLELEGVRSVGAVKWC